MPAPSKLPNIIKLIVTPNAQHVVAVTDDKSIHVFEAPEGRLAHISSRCMPKRPCAIQITPDNETILAADKFGDVYGLPLIPATIDDVPSELAQQDAASQIPFKPAASTATVHSQRNLQALAAQMNQKNFTPRKGPAKFEHKLLLGHVSMLTDVKFLTREVDGRQRGYIVTADRDEHIRISRGPPQTHIIEGYCLGHTDFVNKICQVGNSAILVSGGGDDWLGVWNWHTFELVQKLDLKSMVMGIPGKHTQTPDFKLAVAGIWCTEVPTGDAASESVIIVTCERVHALFLISRTALQASGGDAPSSPPSSKTAIELPGYPIDITVEANSILVSLDVRGADEPRLMMVSVGTEDDASNPAGPALRVRLWEGENDKFGMRTLNQYVPVGLEVTDKEVDDLVYNVANLRKRGPQDPQQGAEGEEE
jgi:tRNA (guanine-N(7)-)-methyltransferase subunit TRM82